MCTLILLHRPDGEWPLIIAANRDEMAGRPWKAPGRHWPDRPEVVAGLDELAGGSWLGVNEFGVVAAVLNRVGTLGPEGGKRSRGELVLEALDHADAVDAVDALSQLRASSYRPFNMLVGDNRDVFWVKSDGSRVEVHPIASGAHMLTAMDLDDAASPRVQAILPRVRALAPPDPGAGDWGGWPALLADGGSGGEGEGGGEEAASLCFTRADGFGTVSGSLIALPAAGREEARPVWLFAPGRPDRAAFGAV